MDTMQLNDESNIPELESINNISNVNNNNTVVNDNNENNEFEELKCVSNYCNNKSKVKPIVEMKDGRKIWWCSEICRDNYFYFGKPPKK